MESIPNTTFIYALIDPRTKAVRYVGKAKNPYDRLHGGAGHLAEAKRGHMAHTRRIRWLVSLLSEGLTPEVVTLEEVPIDSWESAERKWIAHYRTISDLTNATDGGDGLHNPTADTRQRMSQSHIGMGHSDETRLKISLNHRGYNSEETRKKIGDRHRGRIHTAQTRANMSAAHVGYKPTPEQIEKTRLANTGQVRSASALTNIRNSRGKTAEQRVATATEIIERLNRGESYRAIARATGINKATVHWIAHGKFYRDLPRPWHPKPLPPRPRLGRKPSAAHGLGLIV